MSQLTQAIRYQRRKVANDRRALRAHLHATRALVHDRASSPWALLAGFGGGVAFGWLCTSRGSARQRLLSAVRMARPLGVFSGLWVPLVELVLRRGGSRA